jgi:hypothetical protein
VIDFKVCPHCLEYEIPCEGKGSMSEKTYQDGLDDGWFAGVLTIAGCFAAGFAWEACKDFFSKHITVTVSREAD